MPRFRQFLMFTSFFFVSCLLFQIVVGAYGSDRGQTNDEAAHFVTSLMIHDYLFGHIGENPLRFAKGYYQHFPRVTLGHWPPVFELAEAALFVFGRDSFVAIVFQAAIAGLFAGLPAGVVGGRLGFIPGFAAGAIVFFSPYALFLTNTVMADNFLGVLVFMTASAWENFFHNRTWKGSLLFAVLASTAILTKGSAFALAIFPSIDLTLRRGLGLLVANKTVLSVVVIAIATIPWYVATYKYAVDGFNYRFGWDFTKIAVPKYTFGVGESIGLPLSIGYLVGIYQAIKGKCTWIISHVAVSSAIIIFDCVVPADITIRYLIPALPSLAVVSVAGLESIFGSPTSSRSHPNIAATLGIPFCVLVSIATIYRTPRVEPFRARDIVALIEHQAQSNPLVLVSGGVEAEGAIIAAFAEHEAVPYHYAIRGTKVLGSGNFMGEDYRARFADASDLTTWIRANHIGYIIESDDKDGKRFAHNQTLATAIQDDKKFFREIAVFESTRGDIHVYQTPDVGTTPALGSPIFAEIELQK